MTLFFNTMRNTDVLKWSCVYIAGLEVLHVINKLTEAAVAYGLHRKMSLQNMLIVDLGVGTLDVSSLSIQSGMFFTQAMAGNVPHSGHGRCYGMFLTQAMAGTMACSLGHDRYCGMFLGP